MESGGHLSAESFVTSLLHGLYAFIQGSDLVIGLHNGGAVRHRAVAVLLLAGSLLKLHHLLLHALYLRHVGQRYLLDGSVEDQRQGICCVLRHHLSVRAVAVEDAEEPVEWLRPLWK